MPIKSFSCRLTASLYETNKVKKFESFESVALRKLVMLNAAVKLSDLMVPPNNRLEALSGDRIGQHSIRINDKYRICFKWTDSGAEDVEICDYH